jgi:predicted RND superfamily exporter protein
MRLRSALAALSVWPGRMACSKPHAAIGVIAAVSLLMAWFATALHTDDALGSLLRADTPDYSDYLAFEKEFPASEYDVLVALKWTGPFDTAKAEAIRTIHLESQLLDQVRSVTSIFSLREPPAGDETPPTVLPEVLPQGEDFKTLIAKVLADPMVPARLLYVGEKGGLAIAVATLKSEIVGEAGLVPAVRALEETARTFAEPAGIKASLTGIPVMKTEIIVASSRDRVVFPVLGFLTGMAVCYIFFRNWRYVVICMLPSSLAVLCALGLFGLLGLELDPVKNAILPLVMVVALTDTLHISITAQVEHAAGQSLTEAAHRAVNESGAACALTAATTAIAFLSMNLTDSDLISSFGTAAAIATLFEYLLVITAVPALFILLAPPAAQSGNWQRTKALRALGRLTSRLADVVVRWHKPIALGGISIMALFLYLHLQVPPYYRLSDLVPRNQQAALTADEIEKTFGGIYPVSAVVRWQSGMRLESDAILSAIAHTHAEMEATKGVTKVLSADTFRRWLGNGVPVSGDKLTAFLDKCPEEICSRFVGKTRQAAVITGYFTDLPAHVLLDTAADLRRRLADIEQSTPGFTITVTDLSVMAASRSTSIIGQLNASLLSTIVLDLPTIAFAFGSLAIVAYGAVANIFAVVAMGALLFTLGSGVQYASIIALTVTFGLTADGTIHFLNRVRLERARGTDVAQAVHTAITHVGAVLILSTIILLLGLAVTFFSVVPPTRMFGQICALTLVMSLPGLLVLMPALIVTLWHRAVPAKIDEGQQAVSRV